MSDDVLENQVTITGDVIEIPEEEMSEETTEAKQPKMPFLQMGKEKKTDKVVITVTALEKQWIQYLAKQNGFENVTDYMLSFLYDELTEIMEEDVLSRRKRRRKSK